MSLPEVYTDSSEHTLDLQLVHPSPDVAPDSDGSSEERTALRTDMQTLSACLGGLTSTAAVFVVRSDVGPVIDAVVLGAALAVDVSCAVYGVLVGREQVWPLR